VGYLYLAALIFGLGATLLQVFGSTSGADADADAGSSGDSETEGDAHLSSGEHKPFELTVDQKEEQRQEQAT